MEVKLWDLGKIKHRDPSYQYLNGTVTPIHLVVHQLDAMLHALWRQQFGLAYDSWKQSRRQRMQ